MLKLCKKGQQVSVNGSGRQSSLGRLGCERRMRSCSDVAEGDSLAAANQFYHPSE